LKYIVVVITFSYPSHDVDVLIVISVFCYVSHDCCCCYNDKFVIFYSHEAPSILHRTI